MSSQDCIRQRLVKWIVVNPAVSVGERILQASSIQMHEKSMKVFGEFMTKTNDVVTQLSSELGTLNNWIEAQEADRKQQRLTWARQKSVNSTPTNTARTELHSISHFITGTSVAQDQGLHIFVSLKQLSSTCHVSFLAALDTDYKHKFSVTLFIHFFYLSDGLTFTNKHCESQPTKPCDGPRQSGGSTQIPSLTGYEPKSVEFKDIDTEAIEPEDLEPIKIELDRDLGTDPYQIQERFTRNSPTEDMDEFGKVGADTSYLQSQMHTDYDLAESIAYSDLEDGELRKMMASPLYLQSRENYESS